MSAEQLADSAVITLDSLSAAEPQTRLLSEAEIAELELRHQTAMWEKAKRGEAHWYQLDWQGLDGSFGTVSVMSPHMLGPEEEEQLYGRLPKDAVLTDLVYLDPQTTKLEIEWYEPLAETLGEDGVLGLGNWAENQEE